MKGYKGEQNKGEGLLGRWIEKSFLTMFSKVLYKSQIEHFILTSFLKTTQSYRSGVHEIRHHYCFSLRI